MSIKLLESLPKEGIDVAQQIDDGALINFQAMHRLNGKLFGCLLTNSTSTIEIGPGLLVVQGYRLKIEEVTEIIKTNEFPATIQDMYLYLVITRAGNDATYSFELSASSTPVGKSKIEQEEGSFWYKMAKVKIGPNGIGQVESYIASIPASISSGDATTNQMGSLVPAPKLEIVANAAIASEKRGITAGVICLGNKHEYNKFQSNYTIKFVLYRYLQRGRQRERAGDNKLYIKKTGYVKPRGFLGWRQESSTMKLEIAFNELERVLIAKKGIFEYERTDVIDTLDNVIDNMFYYDNPDTQEKEVITGVDQAPGYVRASRSKKLGAIRKTEFRHNYIKFGYKAEIYDINNNLVATSPLSNVITIRPNRAVENINQAVEGKGQLFKITIN